MTKKERWWWTGSATISATIAAAISLTIVKGFTRGALTASLDERLTKAVNEIKPALPKKVDELTTLIDVWHVGKEVTYLYEIDTGGRQIRSDFVTVARKAILPRVCGSSMRNDLINDGVIYVYRYNLPGGSTVGKFAVTASDCT
jgi:hypothetical protein